MITLMARWTLIFMVCAALSGAAWCQDSSPSDASPKPSAASDSTPAETEQDGAAETAAEPSAPALPPDLRDPFWPVGYTPKSATPAEPSAKTPAPSIAKEEPQARAGDAQWDKAIKKVNIRGIMRHGSGTFVAMINNQVTAENDVVSVVFDHQRYRWRVVAINHKNVRLVPLDVVDSP